jgi:ATP-dependent DNA helicase RecQ
VIRQSNTTQLSPQKIHFVESQDCLSLFTTTRIFRQKKFPILMLIYAAKPTKYGLANSMKAATTKAILEKLKQVFNHDQFRGEQEAIIKNVLAGKNTFVIMPTGGGKSLCYQIPALMQAGVAIVISPLLALMKNQVDRLHAVGVNAAFVNSTLSKKVINEIRADVLSGKTKLLYVAPESLLKEDNLAFLKQACISFIAVDEAHCISDWGHDFRPEYRKIKTVLDQALGALPMIGLTATATPRVQQDILKNLAIENAMLFRSSFNRENLYYEIRPKTQVEKQLIRFIKGYPKASGIVYCQSRKKVEELTMLLNLNGIQAVPYHAGLDPKTRIQYQDAFLNKEVDVIVATIAFGMGIDKPDVRFVIHYDAPRSLEGYYQETGRAGRDGLASTCLMFYSEEDVIRMEKLNKKKPTAEREKAQAQWLFMPYQASVEGNSCSITLERCAKKTVTTATIVNTLQRLSLGKILSEWLSWLWSKPKNVLA